MDPAEQGGDWNSSAPQWRMAIWAPFPRAAAAGGGGDDDDA